MTIEKIRKKYPQETIGLTDTEIEQYKTVAESMAEAFLCLIDKGAAYDQN